MKFSDDLYQLIHALTPSEKRYIKIVVKAFSSKGTETQLALFKAFERQANFDEAKIRKKFEKIIPSETFHLSKNRLYKLVIKALYLFHSTDSESEISSQHLFQSNILHQKGLFKQAQKLNKKAFKIAKKTENYPTLLKAYLNNYNQALEERDFNTVNDHIDKELSEELEIIEYYKNDLIYYFLQQKILLFVARYEHIRDKKPLIQFQELKQHSFITDESIKKSSKAKEIFASIKGYICIQENNYGEAILYWNQLLPDLSNVPSLPKKQIGFAITNINNLMFLYLEAKQYKNAAELRQKLYELEQHKHVQKSAYLQLKIQARILELDFKLALGNNDYQSVTDYLEHSYEYIQTVIENTDKIRQLTLQLLVITTFIVAGDLTAAQEVIHDLLSDNQLKKYPHLLSKATLLNLLIHFELENTRFLEALITNLNLKKNTLVYKIEVSIFDFITKYLRASTTLEKEKLLQDLKKILKKATENPLEQTFMPFLNFHHWIDSQLLSKSIVELQ